MLKHVPPYFRFPQLNEMLNRMSPFERIHTCGLEQEDFLNYRDSQVDCHAINFRLEVILSYSMYRLAGNLRHCQGFVIQMQILGLP